MKAVPRDRWVIFFSLAALGCAVDLATKHWAFNKLGMPDPFEHRTIPVIGEYLVLETHLNEGALFGVGQGRASMFAAFSIAAACAVLYWLFVAGAAIDRLLTIALGAVSGGIVGNLYDRLGWHGLTWTDNYRGIGHEPGDRAYAVRDWLHFKIDEIGFDWPVFNVADSLLVCGAALLVLHALIDGARQKAAA